jgi:hypothetical protein
MANADYDVGYKKPPRHSQFKPGNRANPRGRGKRIRPTEAEIFYKVMNELAEYRERGKRKQAPRIEVLVKACGNAALRGDVGAADKLLKLRTQFKNAAPFEEPIVYPMSMMDA